MLCLAGVSVVYLFVRGFCLCVGVSVRLSLLAVMIGLIPGLLG